MRTILAPGVEIREIDKSQYSPAMTGSNCFVMGLTDKGEPYKPIEFTNAAAWSTYYGTPSNEAERYAYAAANEVINKGGRLYFSRLPYDNPAFEKVVGFKYYLRSMRQISENTPFNEIYAVDNTVKDIMPIEPAQGAALYDLSSIDEYRTDENKVAANTFLIADISYNTYGRVQEDDRKDSARELIGIMPVITTAANAMHAQNLISVRNDCAIGYETIGVIRTLDAASQLSAKYPSGKYDYLSALQVRESDMCKLINTSQYYTAVETISVRINANTEEYSEAEAISTPEKIRTIIRNKLDNTPTYIVGTWNNEYALNTRINDEGKEVSSFAYTYMKQLNQTQASCDSDVSVTYREENWANTKFGYHNQSGDDSLPDTVSFEANSYFPTVNFDGEHFDREHLKKIGVVVYKMFMDPSEGNKINFEPVEAFAGSLNKRDVDQNTGVTTFIDTIINSQSQYINFFSNCFNTAASRKKYDEELDMLVVQPGAAHSKEVTLDMNIVADMKSAIDKITKAAGLDRQFVINKVGEIPTSTNELVTILMSPEAVKEIKTLGEDKDILGRLYRLVQKNNVNATVCPSMGFYQDMTKKDISISKSLFDGMAKSFKKAENINDFDIDIVPDAGLANIASYLKAIYGDKGEYDLGVTDDSGNSLLGLWKCNSSNLAVKMWKTIEQKLDNFCKNVRKDCMFIADGMRPLVLQGQKKIVRDSKPANTIDTNIIPDLKWMQGLNTSYGAAYVDWFETADDYSGDFFWCPPSIKAMGVYINTDVNYNYWDAPAGLNRGVIDAVDVAFSPTVKQAGAFYEKNFNYAINYPNDGIVLEGQKTLQIKPSAFDRVNVRRLFCRLERQAYKVARYFVYEGNTSYTRQRLIDALEPYFKDAKNNGGIYEYRIKCDESNNTPESIDRNELHVAIGIKPVKTAEFIMIDFVALRTGGSWTEAGF